MKLKFPIALLLFLSVSVNAQTKDIIKTVNLIAGVQDSIYIQDLFYSENYNVEIEKNSELNLYYNPISKFLIFNPSPELSGIQVCNLMINNELVSFPARIKLPQYVSFSYTPTESYNILSVFGEFNGWNRLSHPLKDVNGDGRYTAKIAIDPGKYQYKFYADGLEIVDPSNPDSISNGMGSFNSIITVAEKSERIPQLHIGEFTIENESSVFTFQIHNPKKFDSNSQVELICFLDNSLLKNDYKDFSKGKLTLTIPEDELKGEHLLRVTGNFGTMPINMQYVKIYDGKPKGNNAPFDWFDGVIYSLMIDRFNDGDPSNNNPVINDSLKSKANYMGGDLKGIINKLNEGYFDSLGVNTIWISPVYDNPNEAFKEYPAPHRYYSGYHGYWPINHHKVEEHFGNLNQLKEFVKLAHRHKIKVLLDFVSNHVHKEHPYFTNHRDWFGKLELPDGRLNLRFWDEFRLTTWFEPYLPSFDYQSSPEALDTMTTNAVWLLQQTGADGYRHDAVKHVPNLFWRELTRKLKFNFPETHMYQIGETFGNYDLVSSYVNNGQLDAQFNFNLYNTAQAVFIDSNYSFSDLDKELKKTSLVYGPLHTMGNIMDSHDKNRYMAYADSDLRLEQWSAIEEGWNNPPTVDHSSSYKKAELYYSYMFTIPGLPVIYYGSEFGMTGFSDPDNRRMMRFDEQLSENEREMLKNVSEIAKLRNTHTALRYGDFVSIQANKKTFAYVRSDFNERILVVLNKSEKSQKVNLTIPYDYDCSMLTDIQTGQKIFPERDDVSIVIEGISFRLFKLN